MTRNEFPNDVQKKFSLSLERIKNVRNKERVSKAFIYREITKSFDERFLSLYVMSLLFLLLQPRYECLFLPLLKQSKHELVAVVTKRKEEQEEEGSAMENKTVKETRAKKRDCDDD